MRVRTPSATRYNLILGPLAQRLEQCVVCAKVVSSNLIRVANEATAPAVITQHGIARTGHAPQHLCLSGDIAMLVWGLLLWSVRVAVISLASHARNHRFKSDTDYGLLV